MPGALKRVIHEATLVTYNLRGTNSPQEGVVTTARKPMATIYVDKSCHHWVVRDPDGNFWTLPSVELPWDERQPHQPTAETELEPVPGHYKDMLRLPF